MQRPQKKKNKFARAFGTDEFQDADNTSKKPKLDKLESVVVRNESAPNNAQPVKRADMETNNAFYHYDLWSMFVLMYAHVDQGVSAGSLFDSEKQTLRHDDPHFDF